MLQEEANVILYKLLPIYWFHLPCFHLLFLRPWWLIFCVMMDDGWASASAVLQRFPFKAIKLNRSELSETAIKTILFYVLHSNTAHYMPKGKGSLFLFFFIITKEYVHSISSLTSPCDSMVWKSESQIMDCGF